MPITITFFAHATTYDNEAKLATGQANTAISPSGKEQIKNLKKLTENKSFDLVYCSDLSRSKETAEGAFGDRFKIVVDERLRELNVGTFTGKSDSFVDSKFKEYLESPFPDGESIKDVEIRMNSFLNDLRKIESVSNVAIVAHMFNQLALEVLLNKKSWKEAIDTNWRKTNDWKPGWDYVLY